MFLTQAATPQGDICMEPLWLAREMALPSQESVVLGAGLGDIHKGSSNPELGNIPTVDLVPPGEGTACVLLNISGLKTITTVGRDPPHSLVAVLHWDEKAEDVSVQGSKVMGLPGWWRQEVTLEQGGGVGM